MSQQRVRLAEDLLSFAQLAPKALSENHLLGELRRRIEPFGVVHVTASVTADANKNFKLATTFGHQNMAWAQVYVGSQLYLNDPVARFALQRERSLYWEQATTGVNLTKAEKAVLGVANELGAKDGYLVPLPLFTGDVMVVSYQGEHIDRDPDVEAYLRSLALYYGIEGYRLAHRQRLNASALLGVTQRQMEILHLAAMGRTNKAIAEELGISVSTVEFHLRRVRDTLGASNTKEAIAVIHSVSAASF